MTCIALTVFILALLAVLLGFIGLVVLIRGFVDKNTKGINKGTIIVCIALAMIVTGAFVGSLRCYMLHKQQRNNHEMMMHKMMGHEGMEMFMDKECCEGDSAKMCKGDKMMIEKKEMKGEGCDKKCDHKTCDPAKCPHDKK